MKEEYTNCICAICGAPADGLHYGAISCRSCNAFFRRTVVEKAEYRCKGNGNCIIDTDGRCGCRACRYNKCIMAGMKVTSVQPRRDPTGSQKERRKRNLDESPFKFDSQASTPLSVSQPLSSSSLLDAFSSVGMNLPPLPRALPLVSLVSSQLPQLPTQPRLVADRLVAAPIVQPLFAPAPCVTSFAPEHDLTPAPSLTPIVVPQRQPKLEPIDDEIPSTSESSNSAFAGSNSGDAMLMLGLTPFQEYQMLVSSYRDHTRHMQLNFASIDSFLDEIISGPKLREMKPTDVDKLSTVELTGLLFWTEKMYPFKELPAEDRGVLLSRYSVRKLSLDHFYNAARFPDQAAGGNFVMNNYTYVPPDKTGFELPNDDQRQIEAKKQTFAATYERFWKNVIHPFIEMKITDAEIVYLQIMLLWSTSNRQHVTEPTRERMKDRREWAMNRLFEWYGMLEKIEGRPIDAGVRFGQVTLLLGEIEIIADMHCQDFQVAKLFEFCDMSDFWYETLCYTAVNTSSVNFDPNFVDNLKRFTAMGFFQRNQLGDMPMPEMSKTPSMNEMLRPPIQMTVAASKLENQTDAENLPFKSPTPVRPNSTTTFVVPEKRPFGSSSILSPPPSSESMRFVASPSITSSPGSYSFKTPRF